MRRNCGSCWASRTRPLSSCVRTSMRIRFWRRSLRYNTHKKTHKNTHMHMHMHMHMHVAH